MCADRWKINSAELGLFYTLQRIVHISKPNVNENIRMSEIHYHLFTFLLLIETQRFGYYNFDYQKHLLFPFMRISPGVRLTNRGRAPSSTRVAPLPRAPSCRSKSLRFESQAGKHKRFTRGDFV
jgi:hypothetical protein